jgi:hypothetical protein
MFATVIATRVWSLRSQKELRGGGGTSISMELRAARHQGKEMLEPWGSVGSPMAAWIVAYRAPVDGLACSWPIHPRARSTNTSAESHRSEAWEGSGSPKADSGSGAPRHCFSMTTTRTFSFETRRFRRRRVCASAHAPLRSVTVIIPRILSPRIRGLVRYTVSFGHCRRCT